MNSSNLLLFISLVYLLSCGIVSAERSHPSDILTKPKDDCGNECGNLNTNTKDNKCGDPDKKNEKFLKVIDSTENNEEKTEYFDPREYECVDKCPTNYQQYKTYNICVMDSVQFEKEIGQKKVDPIDDKLDYTWWIVGGVAGLLIVAIIVAFVFIKSRSG